MAPTKPLMPGGGLAFVVKRVSGGKRLRAPHVPPRVAGDLVRSMGLASLNRFTIGAIRFTCSHTLGHARACHSKGARRSRSYTPSMRPLAASLAVCLAFSVAALGWVGLTGGGDDQPLQAQRAPEAQPVPQSQPRPKPQRTPRAQTSPVTLPLKGDLGPRYIHTWLGPAPHLVAAAVVGHTFRYVLREDAPAQFLEGGVSTFLYDFRFGEEGRSMVVRLLDGDGRFAWAAGYDGVSQMWVRARPDLARCGPIWYAKGHTLPPGSGVADAPPCRLEPAKGIASTVLR